MAPSVGEACSVARPQQRAAFPRGGFLHIPHSMQKPFRGRIRPDNSADLKFSLRALYKYG